MFKLQIISGIVAFLFVAGGHFFLLAYDNYMEDMEQVKALTFRARLMKEQKRQIEQKTLILSQANRFVEKANALGLKEEKWSVYDVNIKELSTFQTMERILNLCANSAYYYFNPVSIHIKTNTKSEKKELKKVSSTSADSPEIIHYNTHLNLNGAFVVRHY